MKLFCQNDHVIYTGPKSEDAIWGVVQFPHCYDTPEGYLALMFHDDDDVWTALGPEPKAKWLISQDKGKTWRPATNEEKNSMGNKLPNGDLLRIIPNSPIPVENGQKGEWYFATKRLPTDDAIIPKKPENENTMPRYIATHKDVFEQNMYVYWLDSIPDKMLEKRFCFLRFNTDKQQAKIEYVLPDWNYRLVLGFFDSQGQYMLQNAGLYQCRDIKVAPDGSLYVAHYSGFGNASNPFNGVYEQLSCAYIFKSEDNGKNWKICGHIPYKEPDEEKDKFAHLHGGFFEPDIEFMPDGSMLCILRTCCVQYGAPEWGPTYLCRSYDKGKTWTKPEYFTDRGALPKLLQLKNGITLAVITRPGIYIYASEDNGKTWNKKIEVMTDKDRSTLANVVPEKPNFHQWCGSCCNCYIKAIDNNKALLFYTDFYVPDENGIKHKGVKCVEIVAERD